VAIRPDFVLAGTGAAGTSGAELVWFSATGASAPTDAITGLSTTPASEVQTVTITGTPTGGTFTLSLGGATTAALAYNAPTATVQTALQGLSTIGSGNVTVTGTAGTTYTCTFAGTLANQDVATMTAVGSLTGGTSPTVGVATTTPGTPGWLSAGLITEDGASENVKDDSTDLRAYGVAPVVRKLTTSTDITVKTVMMEINKVTAAVYHKVALGSITVTGGAFSTTTGPIRSTRYAMVTDLIDDTRRMRSFYPNVENTTRGTKEVKTGSGTFFDVELTAYPDSSGVAVYTYFLVPGLT
jgi:hypothetical protein